MKPTIIFTCVAYAKKSFSIIGGYLYLWTKLDCWLAHLICWIFCLFCWVWSRLCVGTFLRSPFYSLLFLDRTSSGELRVTFFHFARFLVESHSKYSNSLNFFRFPLFCNWAGKLMSGFHRKKNTCQFFLRRKRKKMMELCNYIRTYRVSKSSSLKII